MLSDHNERVELVNKLRNDDDYLGSVLLANDIEMDSKKVRIYVFLNEKHPVYKYFAGMAQGNAATGSKESAIKTVRFIV